MNRKSIKKSVKRGRPKGSKINSKITAPTVLYKKDELDIMRDLFASFESLPEDGKLRVMAYFVNKYSKYINAS